MFRWLRWMASPPHIGSVHHPENRFRLFSERILPIKGGMGNQGAKVSGLFGAPVMEFRYSLSYNVGSFYMGPFWGYVSLTPGSWSGDLPAWAFSKSFMTRKAAVLHLARALQELDRELAGRDPKHHQVQTLLATTRGGLPGPFPGP